MSAVRCGCLRTSRRLCNFCPKALAKFLAEHREIRIHLEEHVSSVIAQAVTDRVADIGIISDIPTVKHLELLPFHDDELALVVRPGHKLASSKTVRFCRRTAIPICRLAQ